MARPSPTRDGAAAITFNADSLCNGAKSARSSICLTTASEMCVGPVERSAPCTTRYPILSVSASDQFPSHAPDCFRFNRTAIRMVADLPLFRPLRSLSIKQRKLAMLLANVVIGSRNQTAPESRVRAARLHDLKLQRVATGVQRENLHRFIIRGSEAGKNRT